MTYRILVTGSRTWTDADLIESVLDSLLENLGRIVIVHGTADGADRIADKWGIRHFDGVTVARYPANWGEHGRRAGYLRNKAMVESGIDLCLAFIKNESRGATHCADLAERAGIETRRFT